MSGLYKNWMFHNIVAHPLSQIIRSLTGRQDWADWIHDVTVPRLRKKDNE
jgi:hypothetical protein